MRSPAPGLRCLGVGMLVALLLVGCTSTAITPPVKPPDALPAAGPPGVGAISLVPPTQAPFRPQLPSAAPRSVTSLPALTSAATSTSPPVLTPTASPVPVPSPNSQVLVSLPQPTPVWPGDEAIPTPFPLLSPPDTVNFLLAGADKRPKSSFRTDSLIVVSIRPHQRSVSLLSIPRDLYVYIPGVGQNRVNTVYQHGELAGIPGGGPALLKATFLYNLGLRIDHLALVDFNGFRRIVDTLGGIDLPLACPYTDWHIIDPNRPVDNLDNWELFTLGPGRVHMDGDLALWYARSRLKSSDFDRSRRQQEVIRAIYARALRVDALPRLPELFTQTQASLTTDLTLPDLLALAPLARNLDAPHIRSYYLGRKQVTAWQSPTGASVLLPKDLELRTLIEAAMAPPGPLEVTRLSAVVEIYPLATHPDWALLAAERLHYAGYETRLFQRTALPTDSPGDRSQTLLYDLTAAQDADQAASLLALLGLPVSRLRSLPIQDAPPAYRLLLAADYDPCFDPILLSH